MSTRVYAIAAASAAIIGIGATYVLTMGGNEDMFADCRTSRVSGGATIGGPFALVDETGAAVTDADIITKPTFVYFGYTFCPDVCPLDSARNADAVDLLAAQGFEVTPVFISVDPRRDTPEVLTEWTDYMHPTMIGLTGTPEQIKAAAQAYKTYYNVPQNPEDEYYLVDHMAHTYLVLPETGFVEFFGRDVSPEIMADRTACFIDAAS